MQNQTSVYKVKEVDVAEEELINANNSIPVIANNFQDLHTLLGVKTNIISYYYNKRDKHQTLVKVGKRETYNSAYGLKLIQKKMIYKIFEPMLNITPNDHMLAYIKGRNFYTKLKEDCTKHDYIVKFDLKKYYDSITKKHIVDTIESFGVPHKAAKLISHYCVVKRVITKKDGTTKTVETLQQGSPCSPIIANLVGYKYIDAPLMQYIKENLPGYRYEYIRFSDNVLLCLTAPNDGNVVDTEKDEKTRQAITKYLNAAHTILGNGYFRYHDVDVTSKKHPKKHQKFLGVILNEVARIDLKIFRRLRATLFNCLKGDILSEAKKYFREETDFHFEDTNQCFLVTDEDIIKKFFQVMTGKIAYIKQVSSKQYTELYNMLALVKLIHKEYSRIFETSRHRENDGRLKEYLFDIVKNYKNYEEVVTQLTLLESPAVYAEETT